MATGGRLRNGSAASVCPGRGASQGCFRDIPLPTPKPALGTSGNDQISLLHHAIEWHKFSACYSAAYNLVSSVLVSCRP